jgi:Domain of unknown function (DUF1707)/Cell wall-active antibiotics response 4TMS YvqF
MRKSILQCMPPRSAPRDLRASDSDRERVVAMLGEALADGRLSHEEYSERMAQALSARTLGDLATLTTDLAAPEHQPVQLDNGQPVTALFGPVHRRGRWVVPATLTCVSAFGEIVLDMSEAILQDRHTVLNVYALFGRLRLTVPTGVEVVMNGSSILGRQRGGTTRRVPTSSDIPVIEVRGYVAASEVLARTPPRPRRWLPGWRKSIS